MNMTTLDDLAYCPVSPTFLVWVSPKAHNIKKGAIAGCLSNNGYYMVKLNGKRKMVHRIIYEKFNGAIPQGIEIDHIDRNTLNNSIANLRIATRSQNMHNRKLVKCGVTYDAKKKLYRPQLEVDGVKYRLPRSKSRETAISTYNNKKRELLGDFLVESSSI